MTASQQALQYRRRAIGALRKANEASASDSPWAPRNLRTYQSLMFDAERERCKIIISYLRHRTARA